MVSVPYNATDICNSWISASNPESRRECHYLKINIPTHIGVQRSLPTRRTKLPACSLL